MPAKVNWYVIIIVAALTAAAGVAAFYLDAFTTTNSEWFKGIALTGFGALIALVTTRPAPVAPPTPSTPAPPADA